MCGTASTRRRGNWRANGVDGIGHWRYGFPRRSLGKAKRPSEPMRGAMRRLISTTPSHAFIKANLALVAAPCAPEIRLYRAHPSSGLSRLLGIGTGSGIAAIAAAKAGALSVTAVDIDPHAAAAAALNAEANAVTVSV